MFIRGALVAGHYPGRPEFLEHNRRLIEDVQQLEHKSRRHDVLLFLGDDILPANDEFFRTHATRHSEHPEHDFAVLGKLDWPDDADFPMNFMMRRMGRL